MKKIIAFVFTLLLPLTACADKFEQGKHYEVLPLAITEQPEVKEFFSFYCPHCFKFEPIMEKLKQGLPANAKLVKSHVNFMPRNNKDVANGLGRALAAANLIKQETPAVKALFEHIHVNRKQFNSMAQVREVLLAAGIDAQKYDSAYNSFVASGQSAKMIQAQDKYRISSVPTIVVNGKYKVISGSAKSEAEYTALVNYLLTKK